MSYSSCFLCCVCSNTAVVYSQFPLNQWRPLLTPAHGNVDGAGFINSEAKLHALCFLASHVYKQVSVGTCCTRDNS